jgi:hypothetical protein
VIDAGVLVGNGVEHRPVAAVQRDHRLQPVIDQR